MSLVSIWKVADVSISVVFAASIVVVSEGVSVATAAADLSVSAVETLVIISDDVSEFSVPLRLAPDVVIVTSVAADPLLSVVVSPSLVMSVLLTISSLLVTSLLLLDAGAITESGEVLDSDTVVDSEDEGTEIVGKADTSDSEVPASEIFPPVVVASGIAESLVATADNVWAVAVPVIVPPDVEVVSKGKDSLT